MMKKKIHGEEQHQTRKLKEVNHKKQTTLTETEWWTLLKLCDTELLKTFALKEIMEQRHIHLRIKSLNSQLYKYNRIWEKNYDFLTAVNPFPGSAHKFQKKISIIVKKFKKTSHAKPKA